MQITPDIKQVSKVGIILLVQIYNVCMGSFLLLFIPQKCGDNVCYLAEILDRPAPQNVFMRLGLTINVITFLSFLFTYSWELKREWWCMKHLDIDVMEAIHNLNSILVFREDLSDQLGYLNRNYLYALRCTSGMCTINFISSAYLIAPHYLDISTLTSFISFAILIIYKLWRSYFIGVESRNYNRAISAYRTNLAVFNTTHMTRLLHSEGSFAPIAPNEQPVYLHQDDPDFVGRYH